MDNLSMNRRRMNEHLAPALSPSAPQTPPTRRGRNAPNVSTRSNLEWFTGPMREFFGEIFP
jgi:hypothetical protein